MRKLTTTIILCAGAGTAHANGFVLNDHGAKATGRADAVVATDIDGSAIVHNVAGIGFQEGINIYLGASLIFPNASFTPEGGGTETETESPMAVTPQVYATMRVHDLLTVGIGFHTPFGSRIVWPESAPFTDEILEQALRTFFITPSAAVNLDKFVPGLSVGAGLDLVPATVELEQALFFGTAEGRAHLGGDGFGVGFRAGVMWNPRMVPNMSVGLAYRSPVTIDFEGTGDFDMEQPFRDMLPPDGDISTSITLPQSLSGGIAYRPVKDLEVELNAVWMGWSSFDELAIELPDDTLSVAPRNYEDTVSIRFGAEYKLRRLGLDLRAGYMYDPTPIPDDHLVPSLPDIDRHDLAFGASYHLGENYKIDFGALWVLPGSNDTADTMYQPFYKGEYDVTAFVASLSLAARFGVEKKED
jgi:long-chain fatty acid transport protein